MRNWIGLVLSSAGLTFSPGCASVTEGTTQTIAVETVPAGAVCHFYRQGVIVAGVETPGSAHVDRTKHNLTVQCEKEGYETATTDLVREVEDATWANVIFAAGFIGWAVDSASGADNSYPNHVSLTLTLAREIEESAASDLQLGHDSAPNTSSTSTDTPAASEPNDAELEFPEAVSAIKDQARFPVNLALYPKESPATAQTVSVEPLKQVRNGVWEGTGKVDKLAPSAECGPGPKILLVVQDNILVGGLDLLAAKGTGGNLAVAETLSSPVDDEGAFSVIRGNASIEGSLSQGGELIEGSWSLEDCTGTFQVSRKTKFSSSE